jgi:hypothetical protein
MKNRPLYLNKTQKNLDVKHEAVRAALVATGLLLGLFLCLFFPVLCRHNDAFQRLEARAMRQMQTMIRRENNGKDETLFSQSFRKW